MKIRTRLTLALVACALVPIAAMMAVGYRQTRKALLIAERDRLETLALLKAAELRTRIERHIQLAHHLRQSFKQAGPDARPTQTAPRAWQGWLLSVASLLDPDTEVAILDSDGTVRAATQSGLIGRNWSGLENLEAGRVRTTTAGPQRRLDTHGPSLDLVWEPILDERGGLLAELVVSGGPGAMRKWLFADLSADIHAMVRGRDGTEIAGLPTADRVHRAQTDVQVRVPLGSGASALHLWRAESEVLRPLIVLSQLGMGAMGLVAVLAVGLAILIGRALGEPVARLAAEARRVAEGDDTRPLQFAPRSDELGELGAVTELMRGRLVEARERIEALLSRRTAKLRENEHLLSTLLEALPDIVGIVGPSRRVRSANQAARRVLGSLEPDTRCFRFFRGQDSICADCPLEQVLAGSAVDEQAPLRSSVRGEAVLYSLAPVRGEGTHITSALYTGRIVTRERTLLTRLAHQEKMAAVGSLAAGIAHDVKNPLASVSALVQARARAGRPLGPDDTALIVEHLRRIDDSVRNLTRSARHSGAGRRPFLLQSVVTRATELVRFDPRARGVRIELECDAGAPAINGDEDAWLHVLLNLLVNALDALEGRPASRIDVRVGGQRGELEVSVQDNGVGMSPDVLAHASEPLFTTKPADRGTGIGLHLVREVVEAHGGVLSLDSQEGAGTRITIRLRQPQAEGA